MLPKEKFDISPMSETDKKAIGSTCMPLISAYSSQTHPVLSFVKELYAGIAVAEPGTATTTPATAEPAGGDHYAGNHG